MSTVSHVAIGVPRPAGIYRMFMLALAVVFAFGGGYFVYLLMTTPAAVPWSFLLASFIFLLGISQFGTAFVAVMRICRARWARPFYRVAEAATLAFLPFAIVVFLLIYTFGREQIFFWLPPDPGAHLSPWLNEEFLLVRNLVAQSLFYALSVVYFLIGLIPDATSDSVGDGQGLRGAFYRWLVNQKQRRNTDRLKTNTYMIAPVVLVLAVVANTFIAWDFAMMLIPHYHSTVFPMYFILGNMLAGTAAIVVLGAVTARTLGLTEYFQTEQLRSIGVLITAFALLWLYMFWAQFFVSWFGNLPRETGPLNQQMFGHYAPYFWTMMVFVFGIPIGSMIFAYVKRHWWSLLTVSAIILVGIWLNRYLLVVPVSLPDHTPFSRPSELLIVGGLVAGFLLVFLALLKALPMVSEWEMRDAAGEEGPAY